LKLRFRNFRSRLLFFLIALLTLLQCATYLLVRQANRQHALSQIQSSLRASARIFEKLIEQRNQQIRAAAAIVSRDHAFQQALAGADQDRETTLSALASLRGRVRADGVLIASLGKELLFDTRRPQLRGLPFSFSKIDREGGDERLQLRVCCALGRALDKELAPYLRLERIYLSLALLA
jgi:Double sensory domain of two-component sensor kinase